MPIMVEHSTANTIEAVENDMAKSVATVLNNTLMPTENNTPNKPPMRQISTASIKNCCKILLCRAPMAMRMPISRVRSVTDTSMIFITPMPPTTSEISAIDEISKVMVLVVLSMVCLMLSLLLVKKSWVPWRATSKSVMLFSAVCEFTPSCTFTVMARMCLSPVILCITVV